MNGFSPSNERADPDGEDGARDVLALPADVEEPTAERERDGEARENERRRDDQRLLHVERRCLSLRSLHPGEEPVEACALEDRAVGRERVLARRDEHDEPSDREREQRCEDGREKPAGLRGDVVALEPRLPHLGAEPGRVLRRVGRRLIELAHAASSPRPPPVIATPSSSSVASGVNSPTISPS